MKKIKLFQWPSLLVAFKVIFLSIIVGMALFLPRLLITTIEGAIAYLLAFIFLVFGLYLFGYLARKMFDWK